MDDRKLEKFEQRLRSFQPEGPPVHLRARVLSGEYRANGLHVLLRVAAVILLLLAVAWNSVLDAPSHMRDDSASRTPLSEYQAYGKLGTFPSRIQFSYQIGSGLIGTVREYVNMEVIR
ncbi:MAG: hypothetical protein JSU70_10920 [Phycisphaerales bacterium]|nr:MAG: hypothetical protein JSU70_10920 [Phycisphaerales bacterium]